MGIGGRILINLFVPPKGYKRINNRRPNKFVRVEGISQDKNTVLLFAAIPINYFWESKKIIKDN